MRQYNIAAAHFVLSLSLSLLFSFSISPSFSISLFLSCSLSFLLLSPSFCFGSTFLYWSAKLKYLKKSRCSRDRSHDFSVPFKCLTDCATDTSYLDSLHSRLLSYFIIGPRDGQQVKISKMRRWKGTRLAAIHHMMYRRIQYIAAW